MWFCTNHFTNILGQTKPCLTFNDLQPHHDGRYSCVVVSTKDKHSGTVTSVTTKLTVKVPNAVEAATVKVRPQH